MSTIAPPELRRGPGQFLNPSSDVWLLLIDKDSQRYVVRAAKMRTRYKPCGQMAEVVMGDVVWGISPSRVFADRCEAAEECRRWNKWIGELPGSSMASAYRSPCLEGLSGFRIE